MRKKLRITTLKSEYQRGAGMEDCQMEIRSVSQKWFRKSSLKWKRKGQEGLRRQNGKFTSSS